MIRVIAPSRLHFGLFHVPVTGEPAAGTRSFGGVGLMVEQPGVIVDVRPAESWQFEGMLASRAQQYAMRFMSTVQATQRRSYQLLVERCAAEHTGLGVGTQLGLAVAKALAIACGEPDLSIGELALRVGRGERSAIGVHGFERGGVLVEAGKLPGETISPLVAHVALPGEWRVVLFLLPGVNRWHGEVERSAFVAAHAGVPDRLREIAAREIILAAESGDLESFGEAVYQFNRLAGEPFAAVQGGTYSSPEVASLIEEVRACGIRGVGQSSWGPTVFALVSDEEAAKALVSRIGVRVPTIVTRISHGARY